MIYVIFGSSLSKVLLCQAPSMQDIRVKLYYIRKEKFRASVARNVPNIKKTKTMVKYMFDCVFCK